MNDLSDKVLATVNSKHIKKFSFDKQGKRFKAFTFSSICNALGEKYEKCGPARLREIKIVMANLENEGIVEYINGEPPFYILVKPSKQKQTGFALKNDGGFQVMSVKLRVFLCVILFFLPAVSMASTKSSLKDILAIGKSRVHKKNYAKAREQAVSNSLATAVNQAALGLLPADALADNFEEVNRVLSGNINKFIRNYKVLSESKSEKAYSVLVLVTVSGEMLKKQMPDANDLATKGKLPKLLFMIAEEKPDADFPVCWWAEKESPGEMIAEAAISEALKKSGFAVADHGGGLPPEYDRSGIEKPNIGIEEVLKIGAHFKADAVVVGKAVSEKALNTMGGTIRSFRGTVTARVFSVETGDEIAFASQKAVEVHEDETEGTKSALQSAASMVAEDLAGKIAEGWRNAKKKSSRITLYIGGTSYLGNFVMFRKELNSMPGVKSIQLKEMKADEAAILVDYKGSAKELADALMLKTFQAFGINVYEVARNHLRIELVPEQKTNSH